MTEWQIRVPFASRGESLVDVASHCRTLGDDGSVMREVVLNAATSGLRTAGDLLDRLESMTPAERRRTLDRARAACGLPSAREADIRSGAPLLRLAPNRRKMTIVRTEGGALVERYADETVAAREQERRIAAAPGARGGACPRGRSAPPTQRGAARAASPRTPRTPARCRQMSVMLEAAEARLAAVLVAPAGPSRHRQVEALAQQRAADGPPGDLFVMEVALAEASPGAARLSGEFEALVAGWEPDLQRERFTPTAFDSALAKIRRSGKATPILFGHSHSDLQACLGMIPASG